MTPAQGRSSSRRGWVVALVVLVTLGLLVLLGRRAGSLLPQFLLWVDGLGFWAPLAFILGYAVASTAFVPASILTVAAGALFGIGRGVLWVLVAATLGSAISFLVSRYLARSRVQHWLDAYPGFQAVDRAVSAQGRWIVFLLRLSPAVPFGLLNYGLGLTRITFSDYLIASVGMLPGTFLYVYTGRLAGDVVSLAGGATAPRGSAYYLLMFVGLAATILVTTLVTRIARRALAEASVGDVTTTGSVDEA